MLRCKPPFQTVKTTLFLYDCVRNSSTEFKGKISTPNSQGLKLVEMSSKFLQQIFKKIYGKPSWLVRQRFGPSVLLEFGKPKLDVSKKVLQPTKKGRKFPRRIVKVRGDWHLTTWCCVWEIRQHNRKICDSKSQTEKINQGCAILNGQILTKVIVNPKNWVTDFYFDLGGHLQIRPFKKNDRSSSMWDLFCPNKRVFSLRSDGNYSYDLGNTPADKINWLPFTF